MQTVSGQFTQLSQGNMRPLSFVLYMSFQKDYDTDIDFFTIGSSIIGGTDIIKGDGDAVQEWDKYTYTDYTQRVIGITWTKEVGEYSSVAIGMAEIVLANNDNLFTPNNSSSPLNQYILPGRPIRILAGFGGEVVPVFIGLTDGMPIVDDDNKTVTFRCVDFLHSLLRKPLDESTLYTNQRADQIIDDLLADQGITTAQTDLSDGLVTYPYVYFSPGDTLLNVFGKLMEVEGGRLFMDENGVITFRNRLQYETTPVMTLSPYTNINDYAIKQDEEIINTVVIKGAVRTVQPLQEFGQLSSPVAINAGDTEEVWISFTDPVTTADDPVYIDSATSSYFEVNTASDGSGSVNSTDVTLQSSDLFATSLKLTFVNNGSDTLYITNIVIFATPAVVTKEIYVREQDDTSVNAYQERVLELENDLFQNETEATSKALIILNTFATAGTVAEVEIKGTPALQVDDPITVNMYNRVSNHRITKMTNTISTNPGRYTQVLKLSKLLDVQGYFTIGTSLIGGDDVIAP